MLYLIGLGLNEKTVTEEAKELIQRCKRVYLENYTVALPYSQQQLVDEIGKKVTLANREKVESLNIVDEAKKMDVALLVYGSPLTATTHITLIDEAKKSGIKFKILHNASVLDAVAETGLQLYKFGKIASMPAWKKSFTPDSFMEIVKENQSINAHTLILIDIGLEFPEALDQLQKSAENHKIKLDKLLVCQTLGTKTSKIHYKRISQLKEFTGVRTPYCIIIPSEKLHFTEKEFLEGFEY